MPWLLKSKIEKAGAEKLGRYVTVGAVEFKLWSLELTLHDLVIAKAGAALPLAQQPSVAAASGVPPQLQIKRLYIDAELVSLERLAVARSMTLQE